MWRRAFSGSGNPILKKRRRRGERERLRERREKSGDERVVEKCLLFYAEKRWEESYLVNRDPLNSLGLSASLFSCHSYSLIYVFTFECLCNKILGDKYKLVFFLFLPLRQPSNYYSDLGSSKFSSLLILEESKQTKRLG
ncbi:hypothetical protein AVEN_249206-1 [Araneus ventricosus]|uniref:Uncharacterized protein n=1 Tax=Araneus ventricosus TaxID=182803 RepID=A0A4Y2MFL8_ARAVE|nr:hypothetical protein AVEN_249206-1 [Araneus ventricosus]